MNQQLPTAAHAPTDRLFDRTVVTFRSDRVREEANQLSEQLAAGAAGRSSRFAIDFAAVDYVRSEDLGALIALHKRMEGNGGRLTLLNVRPLVSGVLSVTRLDTLFDVRQAG